jgi:hypothetical protein
MRKSITIGLGMAVIVSMSLLFAQEAQKGQATEKSAEQTNAPQAQASTIKGEIIEMSCYANSGAKGESHKQCAIACAKNGHSLGLLEDGTGKVYTVVSPIEKNTKDALMPFIAEHVAVTGTVIEKGGMSFLNMQSIEKSKI